MKIGIIGYGKMGRTIEEEAKKRNHEIPVIIDLDNADQISGIRSSDIDVAIEFTSPESAISNYASLLKQNIPIVTGTTGWDDKISEVHELISKHNGAFLYAANFSVGVNLLFKLNRQLAKWMNPLETYEPYISESHHKQKKDAPSGTAIALGNQILEEVQRKKTLSDESLRTRAPYADELSIAYTRAGNIIGRHTVSYISEVDELCISHHAFNRSGFAQGAVIAAEWLKNRKGFYNFVDIFE